MTAPPGDGRGAREQRQQRRPGHLPAAALIGDVDAGLLRAGGWRVTGRLPTTPYDDPRDAPAYVDPDELLADGRVDAVALDGADELSARLLPELRAAGLLVLLVSPAPLDVDLVRAARAAGGPEVAVGFAQRWEPWALTVAAALPLAGGVPLQVTVRGWPRGAPAAAELVDLVQGWCGDVAGVVAAPGALPARTLPGGAEVGWALLAAGGATVLVSHDDAPPLVRLSFATARLEAGPLGARWVGGAELPLLPTPDRRPQPLPAPPGTPAGLVATAAALLAGVGGGDLEAGDWPWPADLGDLLAASRVLAALRESAESGALVRTG